MLLQSKLEHLPQQVFGVILIFVSKARTYQCSFVNLLALLANIRMAKKTFLGTNGLAYFAAASVTKKKVF
jgi:hypothetical protein